MGELVLSQKSLVVSSKSICAFDWDKVSIRDARTLTGFGGYLRNIHRLRFFWKQ